MKLTLEAVMEQLKVAKAHKTIRSVSVIPSKHDTILDVCIMRDSIHPKTLDMLEQYLKHHFKDVHRAETNFGLIFLAFTVSERLTRATKALAQELEHY